MLKIWCCGCRLRCRTKSYLKLRATLPVSVFISPNLAIDDNNNLIDQTPEAAQRALDDLAEQAPPLYGEHQFDQLYSELDMSGYFTPGPMSGPATPFGTLSRNLSAEDLPSMASVSNADISVSALHSRLSRLHAIHTPSPENVDGHDAEAGNRTAAHGSDYFTLNRRSGSHSHSPDGSSTTLSRRQSLDHEHCDHIPSGMVTPYVPRFLEVEDLSRVPSYSTAIRSTARTSYHSDLPDYQSATAGDVVVSQPRSPQQAHLRGDGRLHSGSVLSEFFHSRDHSRDRSRNSHDDEERRLRLMQGRLRT
jgi:hypothetical protein